MIELNKETNTLLTSIRGCQVLTYSDDVLKQQVIRYRKNQRWSGVDDVLVSKYGAKYYKEIGMINTLVATAKRHGLKGSVISLNQNNYTAANKLTKQGISFSRTHSLIHKMDEDGLITLFLGYRDAHTGEGQSSFFITMPEYDELWEGVDTSSAMARQEEDIIIRDSKTKESLSTRPFQGITLLRQDLNAYNKMMSQHIITINGEPLDVSYKRVFHDSLKGGGRYYSNNGVQLLKKAHREDILIDGIKTAELDYSATHPRILYTLDGHILSKGWSPYDPEECTLPREIRKLALIIMLYARDKHSATFELSRQAEMLYEEAKELIGELEEHNDRIKQHFYKKDLWKALQHYDSRIASDVLATCMERNICVLPYHDSFRVEEGSAEILYGVLYESWKRVLGNTNNCVVERK